MVTRPKGKLAALLAIFAAIGIVTATGAFTSVSAQRTVSVNVTGDSAALLALQPNSSYASIGNNGELVIDLSGNDSSGLGTNNNAEGINPNANTTFANLFNISNQGTQQVYVSIKVTESNGPSGIEIYPYTASSDNTGFNTSLSTGTDTNGIGLKIDATGVNDLGSFNATIKIQADQSSGWD